MEELEDYLFHYIYKVKGMLNKSCLYISDYIERNKDEYYDCLTRVRT